MDADGKGRGNPCLVQASRDRNDVIAGEDGPDGNA